MSIQLLIRSTRATALIAGLSSDGLAQPMVSIRDTPSCPRCSFVVEKAVALTSASPDGLLDEAPISVRQDTRGRFWVFSNGRLGRVYGAKGSFIAEVGRKGGGPGEFTLPVDVVSGNGDSTIVFDGGSTRATVLDPNLKYVRQFVIPAPIFGSARVSDSRFLVNATIPTKEAIGLPLHIINTTGPQARVEKSFGSVTGEFRANGEMNNQHVVTALSQTVFVSLNTNVYRLHVWNSEGKRMRVFGRSAPWFGDTLDGGIGSAKKRPTSAVSSVTRMNDSTVAVALRIPARNWSSAWVDVVPNKREYTMGEIDFGLLYQTRIEAIDLRSGRLLGVQFVPGAVVGSVNEGFAVFQSTPAGGSQVVIFRVGIQMN